MRLESAGRSLRQLDGFAAVAGGESNHDGLGRVREEAHRAKTVGSIVKYKVRWFFAVHCGAGNGAISPKESAPGQSRTGAQEQPQSGTRARRRRHGGIATHRVLGPIGRIQSIVDPIGVRGHNSGSFPARHGRGPCRSLAPTATASSTAAMTRRATTCSARPVGPVFRCKKARRPCGTRRR